MKKLTNNQIFGSIASVAVVIAVIGGLFIAGSPNQERMRRADQQRLSDLQQISYAISAYMNTNGSLPPSLDELARSPDVYLQSVRDPQTAAPYTYTPSVDGNYQICATFETDSDSGPDQPVIAQPAGFWAHSVGERCFALQAKQDPNMVKPAPVPVPAR